MDPLRELGKVLVVGGVLLAAVGVLLLASGKLPFRLGRLPGDIVYKGAGSSFYFPVVSCIVLSVTLTLLLWVLDRFRR